MTDRMVLLQVMVPAQLREAVKSRAKALSLRPADVARWALAREVDDPTLATKGSSVATSIKMLARGVGDSDAGLAELKLALKSICMGD